MAKWTYAGSLYSPGRVPSVIDMPVAATQTLVVGDLVVFSSGQVAKAGDALASLVGICYEDSASQTAGTLIKIVVLLPGDIIRGTADADASAILWGGNKYDLNATTQTLDVGDSSNGCLQVIRIGTSTTDVYCVSSEFGVGGV